MGYVPLQRASNLRYAVRLTSSQRKSLRTLARTGTHASRTIARARILLAADAGLSDDDNADSNDVDRSTVIRVRRRFATEGLDSALRERPRSGAPRKLTTPDEALLAATACAKPPPGFARWTLVMLAKHVVRLTAHRSLGKDTVRRRLAEMDLKPWQEKMWCIPRVDREFLIRMEDVISLYVRPTTHSMPVVCFDETPIQFLDDLRVPVPPRAGRFRCGGRRRRVDYEYVRRGTGNVFMMIDAHRGWRHTKVTKRRGGADFAKCMQDLVDKHYPHVRRIRVVLDNLSTHTPRSLVTHLGAAEAARLMRRIEFHYTPKHASWLNMAEIEIGVLKRQCLARRIPDIAMLRREVAPWMRERNRNGATIHWMFGLRRAREAFGNWRLLLDESRPSARIAA